MPFFAIYGLHGRVGSCWLAELLNPACLLDPQEIWQSHQRGKAAGLGVTADPYEQPAEYLRQFCAARGVTGARTFPLYMPPPSDERLVTGLDRVVFLYRRNITEQMVSFQIAKHCGWRAVTQRRPSRQLELNVRTMVKDFETAHHSWRKAVKLVSDERRVILAYEDIAQRVVEVRRFLGIEGPVPKARECRQQRSPERYRRIVVNLNEVNERMGERYGVLFGKAGIVDPAHGFADG